MAATAPQTPAGDDRNLVTIDENYLAPSFEDRLQMFWDKHAKTITVLIVLVAVALIGRWGFGVFAEQREQAIRSDYAKAQTADELRAFIDSHPTSRLSGVAALRLADDAYQAGKYAEAKADYANADRLLRGNALQARAKLGAAMAPLLAGDTPAAKEGLQALADDTSVVSAVRAEAAYHLAVLARDGGDVGEVTRWTGVVLTAQPDGIWSQRALQLRSTLPSDAESGGEVASSAAEGESGSTPASVSFPATQ